MNRFIILAAVCVLLLLSQALRAADTQALSVRVSPLVAQAPATVRIEATVAPADANRSLVIVIDSGEYYRSSAIPLDGAQAARVHAVSYGALPGGSYDVRVEVQTANGGTRARERNALQVVP